MTYEMSLNNVGFAELTRDEMLGVDGGVDKDSPFYYVGYGIGYVAYYFCKGVSAIKGIV